VYDSGSREVHNILTEFGGSMKLGRLIKVYLSETFSKFCMDVYLSGVFLVQNGLKQGDAALCLVFNFDLTSD